MIKINFFITFLMLLFMMHSTICQPFGRGGGGPFGGGGGPFSSGGGDGPFGSSSERGPFGGRGGRSPFGGRGCIEDDGDNNN
jgi:hypothetical protein